MPIDGQKGEDCNDSKQTYTCLEPIQQLLSLSSNVYFLTSYLSLSSHFSRENNSMLYFRTTGKLNIEHVLYEYIKSDWTL